MYPMKFLIPNNNYRKVSIHFDNIPQDINTSMALNERNNCFTTTLTLPPGSYSYQFQADGKFIDDILRAPAGGRASFVLGEANAQGIVFEQSKIFIKNNHIVLTLGLDISLWHDASLNIQTLTGLESVKGFHMFFEGSYQYKMFIVNLPEQGSILAYFEISNGETISYFGENGIKEEEWAIHPIEISIDPSVTNLEKADITAIYHISHDKAIEEFEKHIDYFEKFPIDYLAGNITKSSPLSNSYKLFPTGMRNKALDCLMRDIFTEKSDINPAMGLLGRFIYESKQDLATIPFTLSDNDVSFWHLCHRDFATAARGIGFQLLATMAPKIVFGEEIGLTKTGLERSMYWSKMKWNKDLYYYYQKLLKLRQEHLVLRQGRFRFVIQDCAICGIERYMSGEDSVYVLINQSNQNIVVDLTQIMNHTGPIIELLTDHPLKRKRVCTIFANSINVYKIDRSRITETDEESHDE